MYGPLTCYENRDVSDGTLNAGPCGRVCGVATLCVASRSVFAGFGRDGAGAGRGERAERGRGRGARGVAGN